MASSPLRRLLAEPPSLAWLARRSWHPWLVVGLVSIGAFVGQLDATIVQLALPTLGRHFGASLDQVSWIALSYLLAFAAFLPIFGRLCEMLGRKALYIAGYALFVGASALCGLATHFEELLAFRVLQGIGGALLGANSIAILVKTVPAASRGRALGYFAAAQAVGMSAGPALGGLILASLGWRWIFWITVPFGLLAMILGWLALPRGEGLERARGFDWGGALLIGPALALVVATLNHAAGWGMASPMVLGGLAASAALFWLLVRRERHCAAPLIDPLLFQGLAFRCGALAVALAYALLYGTYFLMAFALTHGFGESPAAAGLRLAIIPVAIGLTAPFSSDVTRWLGGGRVVVAGMLLCLGGVTLLALTLGLSPDHRLFDTLAFILLGVGLGIFIAPNSHATIAAAPAALAGPAGALLNLMRALGTSLGVAVGASALAWNLGSGGDGTGVSWSQANSAQLLAATRASLPILAMLAVVAAIAARTAATGGRAREGAARA
jgi:EmrB/QacA subfamily drug resistance transporter